MMNLTQYLLSKMAEEATELAKEALKGQQQGLFSTHRGKQNIDFIRSEFIDLFARSTLLSYCYDIQAVHPGSFSIFPAELKYTPETYEAAEKSIEKMAYYACMAHDSYHLNLTESERPILQQLRDRWIARGEV